PRIEARLPAPRGLSQVTTSFIGSWCLGIHRLPLVACCYYKDARVHCAVLKVRAVSDTTTTTCRRGGWLSARSAPAEAVIRNLRTQQRAWAPARTHPNFHSLAGCTDE